MTGNKQETEAADGRVSSQGYMYIDTLRIFSAVLIQMPPTWYPIVVEERNCQR